MDFRLRRQLLSNDFGFCFQPVRGQRVSEARATGDWELEIGNVNCVNLHRIGHDNHYYSKLVQIFGVADFMYENDFFYAETPVPDVKFHVWNIQIHTSIQQRQIFYLLQPNLSVKIL